VNPLQAASVVSSVNAFALACCVSACGSMAGGPRWSQAHADLGNTNFALNGVADLHNNISVPLGGDPGTSSPVVAPDGSIFVSLFDGPGGINSRIVRALPGSLEPPKTFASVAGQLSTPAIDSAGNVFVVSNSLGDADPPSDVVPKKSFVFGFGQEGGLPKWSVPFLPPKFANVAPKVMELGGVTNVFVAARQGPYSQVLVIDGGTGTFASVNACADSVVGSLPGMATPVPAQPPAPPYDEGPSLAIADDASGRAPYLIFPTPGCGLLFYLLATSKVGWPAGLFYPDFIWSNDQSNIGTPAVSLFNGYVLIAQGEQLAAYDYRTGKAIPNWQFTSDLFPKIPLSVFGNSMLVSRNGTFVLSSVDAPAVISTSSASVRFTLATALSLTSAYVLGRDGLYRFDVGAALQLMSFSPIPGTNEGGMTIARDGTVYVASRNGRLYEYLAK
jgi:outer membrane protein assembly factor BamB